MHTIRHLGWLLGCIVVACDAPAATSDGGPAAPPDAGPWFPDDLPVVAWGAAHPDDPAGIDPATAMPPDFACLGTRTHPPAGPLASARFEIRDWQTSALVEGLCVRGFANDAVTDEGCPGPLTDASGLVIVDFPSGGMGTLAVFARPDPDPARAFAHSLVVNTLAGRGAGVSEATLNLIPTVVGRSRTPGTAILGSLLTDCFGRSLYGVVFRAARADGTYVEAGPGRAEPRIAYGNGSSLPRRDQRWTHVDGLMIGVNLPVPADASPIFLEAWGRLEVGAPPTLLACERGGLLRDGVTMFWSTGPLRSDGPSCPGLSAGP